MKKLVQSKRLNYPPKEIQSEKVNYEHMILWMLSNNQHCRWKDFVNEPLKINPSTLSNKLKSLTNNGCIEKIEIEKRGKKRKYYQITTKGKYKFNDLVKSQESEEKHLSYPPKVIMDDRDYIHIVLWMLYNNNYCQWRDFLDKPLNINQSTLSNKINLLLRQGFIKKEKIPEVQYDIYRITTEGKQKYIEIIRQYNLDHQSILDEESKRIHEITQKTTTFFNDYKVFDDDIKFRFLNNILKLDYSKVQQTCSEEEFNKILLFLAFNHPGNFPKYISLEEFSNKFNIRVQNIEYVYHIRQKYYQFSLKSS